MKVIIYYKVEPALKMMWTFLNAYLFSTVIVSCVTSQLDFGDGWHGGGRFGKRLSAHGQQGGQQGFGGGSQQGGQQGFGGGSQQGGQQGFGGGQQGNQLGLGGGQQGFGGGGQQRNQLGLGGGQQGGQGGGQMQGPGQQKPRPQLVPQSVCVLKADPGYCNLIIGRWYYDFRYHRCLPFLYTGCGGNSNNFISSKKCDQATRQATCHLSPTSLMPPLVSHDPDHRHQFTLPHSFAAH